MPGEKEIGDRIEECLDRVRPYLRVDGGDVRVVRYLADAGVLEIEWLGTCKICPLSPMTLRAGVERALMHDVPGLKRVEAVGG